MGRPEARPAGVGASADTVTTLTSDLSNSNTVPGDQGQNGPGQWPQQQPRQWPAREAPSGIRVRLAAQNQRLPGVGHHMREPLRTAWA